LVSKLQYNQQKGFPPEGKASNLVDYSGLPGEIFGNIQSSGGRS
jgi:hypothetical protein